MTWAPDPRLSLGLEVACVLTETRTELPSEITPCVFMPGLVRRVGWLAGGKWKGGLGLKTPEIAIL